MVCNPVIFLLPVNCSGMVLNFSQLIKGEVKPGSNKFITMQFSAILHRVGLAACILLIISCFLPWAYYADLNIPIEQRTFTGFKSYNNYYGKPGEYFIIFAVINFVLMLWPKVLAKIINIVLAAVGFVYAIINFRKYTSSYLDHHPQIEVGIIIMLLSATVILIATVFPNIKLEQEKRSNPF